MLVGRSLAGTLGVIACAFAGRSVAAEADTDFQLRWIAPPGCPSVDTVQADIDRLLGGPAGSHGNNRLRVRAEVVRKRLWQVTLSTVSPEGNGYRTIEAATCQGLANATALIVALTIDPGAVATVDRKAILSASQAPDPTRTWSPPGGTEATAAPDLAPSPAPGPVPFSPPAPSSTLRTAEPTRTPAAPAGAYADGKRDSTPSPTPHFVPASSSVPASASRAVQSTRTTAVLAGAGASGSLGLLPAADVVLLGELGLSGRNWRFEVRAGYAPRTVKSDVLQAPAGAYGEFQSVFMGTLSGCVTTRPATLEAGGCANVEIGAIRGRGVGATAVFDEYEPWVGVGAGGYLALAAGKHLAFPIHLDAVVPLWRPTYVFTNVNTPIYRPSPVGARLSAAAELRF